MNHINTETLSGLLIYSVRYALGRRSYAVSDVCEAVERHLCDAKKGTANIIAKDVRDELNAAHGRGCQLGDPMGDARWRELLAWLEQSQCEVAE